MTPLSDEDRQLLDFERGWWKYAGAKEQAIRDLFDMGLSRYYQRINALLDDPAAEAYDAALVRRLRGMRERRQRGNSRMRAIGD